MVLVFSVNLRLSVIGMEGKIIEDLVDRKKKNVIVFFCDKKIDKIDFIIWGQDLEILYTST